MDERASSPTDLYRIIMVLTDLRWQEQEVEAGVAPSG
jgi:hypothetical protein